MDTQTETITKSEVSVVETENIVSEEKVINPALLLVFAEFLGFVSPIVKWAEDMCKGKDIEEFKKKAVTVDAEYIISEMKDKYSSAKLNKWWGEYYDVLLKQYEETLEKASDDLPF